MKLFLTSSGISNDELSSSFLKLLDKPVSENRAMIIAYVPTPEGEFYTNQSKNELIEIGFNDIEVVNISHDVDVSVLGLFDVVYVCGGNTFMILKRLKETGLFSFIAEQMNLGAVYVGVSAGSIIAGKNIEIAGWGSQADSNDIELQNLKGLGFTKIVIYPHFSKELLSEVESFRRKTSNTVIELADGQAVLIKDLNAKVVG